MYQAIGEIMLFKLSLGFNFLFMQYFINDAYLVSNIMLGAEVANEALVLERTLGLEENEP